jgi:SAM-dependent methyltransferase
MFSKISLSRSKLRWSLRKLRLPIEPHFRVLEVGSGGNPHPASDVLLEKYLDNSHRLKSIQIDRPIVLADACQMPFKDGAFDYVIAFHVLEHVDQPERFIAELMRVAKAGYIETPNAMYERLHPFDVHLLEVAEHRGKLLIHRKPGPVADAYLSGVGWLDGQPAWRNFFEREPEAFHVCYQWRERIDFEVVNPEQSLDWFVSPPAGLAASAASVEVGAVVPRTWRSMLIELIRRVHASRKTTKVELSQLLACPSCRGELVRESLRYRCTGCASAFRHMPVPDFTAPELTLAK